MSQSGEKTEKATPKKRRDARERGQVMKSPEVNTAFCMLVMFGFMLAYAPTLVNNLLEIYSKYLSQGMLVWGTGVIGQGSMRDFFIDILLSALKTVGPILAVALFSGVLANLLQVGFLFTTKTLAPKFERINPLKGFKRMFSLQSLMQLLKSILKVAVLGYIFYNDYRAMMATFPGFMGMSIYKSLLQILSTTFSLALKMSVAMVAIGAADFLYQFLKHEKDLKMTKQEVKDEYKLTEGNPQIKSRIRQKQRQMSMMRMMDQVPQADVVITNPTHFAVAIKYEEGVAAAPVVIAKGQDYLARKIKEVARENRVQIVENKPLAQTLYKLCDIGQEIPEELYQAVAEVLVFVHRQKYGNRPATRARH